MKKLLFYLMIAVMLVSMAACGDDKKSSKATSTPASNGSSTEKTVYPVTIKDQTGREVTIESKPEKIVSGYYISSSLLIALDLKDKMVGIEAKADKRAIYKLSAKELIDLPSVGSAKEFDLEGCAALEPDLIILPKKLKDAAATLEELGLKVILVNPEDQDLLVEMIDIVSTATDTKDKATELLTFINTQEKLLKDTLASVEAPKVYIASSSDVLQTAGKGMYQSTVVANAGGKNVAEEIEDTYWAETSYEQILAWNPEVIVIAAEADYTVDDVLNDANLAACDAVKNKKVYQFPVKAEAWDSPVPSGILGSVWLANVLHEDTLKSANVDADAIIEEFYEKFYDFKYNEI